MKANVRFAVVNAAKNKVTGAYMKPDAASFTKDSLNAIASADNNTTVTPAGDPGETYGPGELYLGNFDVDAGKFVSDLVAAPAIKLPGNLNPKDVKANDDGSVTENV